MGRHMIEFENGTIQVRAENLEHGLPLTPQDIMQGLCDGTITKLCDKGTDASKGRYRLAFYSSKRRLRLVVDAEGVILKKFSSDHKRDMFAVPLDGKSGAAGNAAMIPAGQEQPK